jgi:hypothetical protein
LIEFFRIKFDTGLDSEEIDDSPHELNSVFLFVDVIRDVGLRVILLSQPVEDICDEFEVRFAEVLKGNNSVIVEGP